MGYARTHPSQCLLTQRFLALVRRNSKETIRTVIPPVKGMFNFPERNRKTQTRSGFSFDAPAVQAKTPPTQESVDAFKPGTYEALDGMLATERGGGAGR